MPFIFGMRWEDETENENILMDMVLMVKIFDVSVCTFKCWKTKAFNQYNFNIAVV